MITAVVLTFKFTYKQLDLLLERSIRACADWRRIGPELVVFVAEDEASSALGTVYFTQWLWRPVLSISLTGAIAAIFASNHMRTLIPKTASEAWGHWLLAIFLVSIPLAWVLSVSAYGFLQGLIAVDAADTVTPAPVGKATIKTIAWRIEDKLRHSLVL